MASILSADNLYHYTKSAESLFGILSSGFRFARLIEVLPYRAGISHALYVVCFCDIPVKDASSHRTAYGSFAIGMSKSWGIRNGISPVRYIHANSPGSGLRYRIAKTLKYDHEEQYEDPIERSLALTRVLRVLHDQRARGLEPEFPLAFDVDIVNRYGDELVAALRNVEDPIAETFRRSYESLFMLINDLHNELELRDKFMRVYEEQVESGTIARRYDEREWRACFIPTTEVASEVRYIQSSDGLKQWVEDKYNLRFEKDDIEHLIVPSQSEAERLSSWLAEHSMDALIPKIQILE